LANYGRPWVTEELKEIGLEVRHQLHLGPSRLAISRRHSGFAVQSPPKGCIHHADRGSQYCFQEHQKISRQQGFNMSMSGKDKCYEFKDGLRSRSVDPADHLKSQNAAVETFFKTIKAELI
jgi:putative transposase